MTICKTYSIGDWYPNSTALTSWRIVDINHIDDEYGKPTLSGYRSKHSLFDITTEDGAIHREIEASETPN